MGNIKLPSEKKSSIIVVGALLLLSLLAAFILFFVLDSFAEIQNKTISIGGAAAGFFLIFILLRGTYFKITSTDREFQNISAEEQIKRLEDELSRVITSQFDNFIVPKHYKMEVSNEFRFAICYPENWEFARFPEQTIYGGAADPESAEMIGMTRNLNVVVSDISFLGTRELDKLYEAGTALVLSVTPKAELIFDEDFLLLGIDANRHLVHWESNLGEKMALYQISVTDEFKKKLYVISFTTTREDFDTSKSLFDDIIATLRI